MREAEIAASADVAMTDTVDERPGSGSEIRLSFGYFYIMLRWGSERRSAGRMATERKRYPVLTASNLPVLLSAWAGVLALSYFALKVALSILLYTAG